MSRSRDLKFFLTDLLVYSILVLTYFVLVLQFFGNWLTDLFRQHRFIYAAVAILLMVTQAVGLEVISYFILKWIRPKKA